MNVVSERKLPIRFPLFNITLRSFHKAIKIIFFTGNRTNTISVKGYYHFTQFERLVGQERLTLEATGAPELADDLVIIA